MRDLSFSVERRSGTKLVVGEHAVRVAKGMNTAASEANSARRRLSEFEGVVVDQARRTRKTLVEVGRSPFSASVPNRPVDPENRVAHDAAASM